MLNTKNIFLTFALLLAAVPARSGSLAYVVTGGITGNGTFGTIDLSSGTFNPLGAPQPDGYDGLATGPNGSLYALTYAGNIDTINPRTGSHTQVGPTGLGACIVPSPACGSNSGYMLGGLGGKLYATDFSNNLYSVSSATGAAKLIGATGMTPFPFVPGTQNSDGTSNLSDEALFSAGGKLYAMYDAFVYNFNTSSVVKVLVAPVLYQLDAATAHATAIAPVALGFGAAVDINGTVYAFNESQSAIDTLDLATGATSTVANFSPSAGLILGAAAPAPEPASWVLLLIGGTGLAFAARTRRKQPTVDKGHLRTPISASAA